MRIFRPNRTEARQRGRRAVSAVAAASVLALLVGACGSDGEATGTADKTATPDATVVREAAGEVGPDPFTTAMGDGDFSDEVAALPAAVREAGDGTLRAGTAPGLYGGTGDVARCDAKALVQFLEQNPDKGGA